MAAAVSLPAEHMRSFPFLRLSAELRLMIYEELLTVKNSPHNYLYSDNDEHLPVGYHPAILRTCRQVYREAEPMLYHSRSPGVIVLSRCYNASERIHNYPLARRSDGEMLKISLGFMNVPYSRRFPVVSFRRLRHLTIATGTDAVWINTCRQPSHPGPCDRPCYMFTTTGDVIRDILKVLVNDEDTLPTLKTLQIYSQTPIYVNEAPALFNKALENVPRMNPHFKLAWNHYMPGIYREIELVRLKRRVSIYENPPPGMAMERARKYRQLRKQGLIGT